MRTWVSAIVATVVMSTLLWTQTGGLNYFTFESRRQDQIEREPRNLTDWQLQDSSGNRVSLTDWADQTVLVNFIFTRCLTICRAQGSRYAVLERELKQAGRKDVHLLSISIDPKFDSPKSLRDFRRRYVKQDHGLWSLARPNDDETYRAIIDQTDLQVIPDEFGGFAHSESLHWIRNGRLVRISDWPTLADSRDLFSGR